MNKIKLILFILLTILILTLTGCINVKKNNIKLENPSSNFESENNKYPANFNNNFRNCKWGMNMLEVKKNESAILLDETNDMIIYLDNVAGLKSTIVYAFIDNKLYMGFYVLNEKHTNNNLYIEDFKKLKNKMINIYGNTNTDNEIWLNELSEKNNLGTEVAMGNLIYKVSWILEKTEILLKLSGDNYNIKTILAYKDINVENNENNNGL